MVLALRFLVNSQARDTAKVKKKRKSKHETKSRAESSLESARLSPGDWFLIVSNFAVAMVSLGDIALFVHPGLL